METENITYIIEEDKDKSTAVDLKAILDNFEQLELIGLGQEDDLQLAQINNYEINYSLKQLCLIYEYYGLGKTSKMKKIDMIHAIVLFEFTDENSVIVAKRRQLWFYLEELKADKFMKRFIWTV